MSVAPAPAKVQNKQAKMPKSMISDPGWFDGDRKNFEDWWRWIRLSFKSNRAIETNNRITTILAQLRKGIAGIYSQKKQIPRIGTSFLKKSR